MSIEIGRERYDRHTIILHWTVAILVVGLWTAGQTIGLLPKGPLRSAFWATHVVAGFTLALILLIYLTWRLTKGRQLAAVGSAGPRLLATFVHGALFVLLVVVVSLGIANAFNRGFDLYGIVKLPQIGEPDLKKPLTQWHELAANVLFALALFHAAAALVHHYLWKDGVLARMAPASSR